MRYLAPAGTPIGAIDLLRWIYKLPRKRAELERLRALMTRRFGLTGCEFVSSGRAGMTLILQLLHELSGEPERNEVVIPGYTCFSVPASIERAGLRVRVCDIDPASLSYDLQRLEQFDFSRVLAVVSANLYGIPNELAAIEAVARRHGVYMVDDAAQGLGATCEGRPVGTFGDVGLYSLDKGKNITSMQGGIIVTRNPEIATALKQRVAGLPGPAFADTAKQVLKLLAYALLLRPSAYGVVARLPFLGLGRTPYETPSPLTQYSAALGAMAAILYDRLDTLASQRQRNARSLAAALEGSDLLKPITAPDRTEPVFVRLPLLAPDTDTRDRLLRSLDGAGIGASASYPSAVVDIAELQGRLDQADLDCPGARAVAGRMLTLPTHSYLRDADVRRTAEIVRAMKGENLGDPART